MSRLRSNKVVNQAGSGAPELTYGAVIPNTGTILKLKDHQLI